MADEEGYEVGYARPPKEHRFQPGRSGNPRGRPKGARSFKTQLTAFLSQRVSVNIGGKPGTVSTLEALLMKVKQRALGEGDMRALEKLLSLAQQLEADGSDGGGSGGLRAEDEAIVAAFLKRKGKIDE